MATTTRILTIRFYDGYVVRVCPVPAIGFFVFVKFLISGMTVRTIYFKLNAFR